MEFTETHLRYLLAIYSIARLERDVCSTSIARYLKVSGASVSRMLRVLMEKQWIVKKRYGKIYLTDQGFLLARDFDRKMKMLEQRIPMMQLPYEKEEAEELAFAMAAVLLRREQAACDGETCPASCKAE
ncbi:MULTISPECIES: metal-dependent transcriptional regulator [Caproicibacterium]|uniref:MarR family transcriptional regulator n=1 Tax=Caproicibacterium argilliputei TaxID=3030016 RepID=A0AA97D8T0_9FIRM|nr:MarR family transcriptional regulator [Caproicibacterium argilliputei]WOC31824.1 MarR family transcriptional regulator [Caproicibacterium argilliputei]